MTTNLQSEPIIRSINKNDLPNAHGMRCRNCRGDLSRIRRGGLVKLFLWWLPLKKYICYNCKRKTYKLSSRKK